MRTFAAVTTFNAEGYEAYGRTMIETFDRHWPASVPLYVYAEDCRPIAPSERVVVLDLPSESPELVAFKQRHKDNPAAHGAIELVGFRSSLKFRPLGLKLRKLRWGSGFHWDAVRFSHKCFAIFAAARRCESNVLFWIDADVRFFADVPGSFLEELLPEGSLVSFLKRWRRPEIALEIVPSLRRARIVDRTEKYSECGFVGYNLQDPAIRDFLDEFEVLYLEDRILHEWEYHDCQAFDVVRRGFERKGHRTHDIGEGIGRETSHPFVNCSLGRYMDHRKGDRKELGASSSEDLIVDRDEPYWADSGDTLASGPEQG